MYGKILNEQKILYTQKVVRVLHCNYMVVAIVFSLGRPTSTHVRRHQHATIQQRCNKHCNVAKEVVRCWPMMFQEGKSADSGDNGSVSKSNDTAQALMATVPFTTASSLKPVRFKTCESLNSWHCCDSPALSQIFAHAARLPDTGHKALMPGVTPDSGGMVSTLLMILVVSVACVALRFRTTYLCLRKMAAECPQEE